MKKKEVLLIYIHKSIIYAIAEVLMIKTKAECKRVWLKKTKCFVVDQNAWQVQGLKVNVI